MALRTPAQALAHLRSDGGGRDHMRAGLLAILLGIAACRPAADRPGVAGQITVTDDAGRRVTLAGPARRIVSLAPSSTELLFALGAGERVVGRTTWCRYPAAARAVPVVGDGLNPNIEAVAARHPDLVVLYASQLNQTAAEQLTRIGIAAVILRQDRLEDVGRDAQFLARLTGRAAAGDSIAALMQEVVTAPVPAPPRAARVAIVVWDNPPTVIGAGSFLDQLVVLAGGTNVFHDLAAASAAVSLETIAARNPDVIVDVAEDSTLPGYASRREWRTVRAVREGRFVRLPGDLFGRPSPRAREAVAELRRRLMAAP